MDISIVSYGVLVAEFHFEYGNKTAYIDGGGVRWNILHDCAQLGNACYAFSTTSSDYLGKLCAESLKKAGINIDNVSLAENGPIYRSFIEKFKDGSFKKHSHCPICGCNSNKKNGIDVKIYQNKFPDKCVVIYDFIDAKLYEDIKILTADSKEMDLILVCNDEESLEFLLNKNLKQRMNFLSHFKLIFLGKIIANEFINLFEDQISALNNIIIVGDSFLKLIRDEQNICFAEDFTLNFSGKFEAIISCFLSEFYKNNCGISDSLKKSCLEKINYILPLIFNSKSSRIQIGNNSDADFEDCNFCGLRSNRVNKKNNLITNANSILSRIKDSVETVNFSIFSKLIKSLKGSTICVGTGGSYAVAVYAARAISDCSMKETLALKPYEIYLSKIKSSTNIILFSYSGTTQDILEIINHFKGKSNKIILITKMYPELVLDRLINKDIEIISYGSENTYYVWEKGFISMAGTVCPATLFARLFYSRKSKDIFSEIESIWSFWNNYFGFYFSKISKRRKKMNVDVFYAFDTLSAARDIESKFIESGFGRVNLHEKKDFSHGRFNILKYCPSDMLIYFINSYSKYDEELIRFLKSIKIPLLIIDVRELHYSNSNFNEYCLLLASQICFRYISNFTSRDLAKPDYPQSALTLYKYDKGFNSI